MKLVNYLFFLLTIYNSQAMELEQIIQDHQPSEYDRKFLDLVKRYSDFEEFFLQITRTADPKQEQTNNAITKKLENLEQSTPPCKQRNTVRDPSNFSIDSNHLKSEKKYKAMGGKVKHNRATDYKKCRSCKIYFKNSELLKHHNETVHKN